jgi:hypothetical protein
MSYFIEDRSISRIVKLLEAVRLVVFLVKFGQGFVSVLDYCRTRAIFVVDSLIGTLGLTVVMAV